MIPIVLIAVALAGILVWALYTEPVPPRPRFKPRRLDLSMTAADIRRHGAPITLAGYDPRWVDAHLGQVASIHERQVHERQVHEREVHADPPASPPPAAPSRHILPRDVAAAQSVNGLTELPGSVLDD